MFSNLPSCIACLIRTQHYYQAAHFIPPHQQGAACRRAGMASRKLEKNNVQLALYNQTAREAADLFKRSAGRRVALPLVCR